MKIYLAGPMRGIENFNFPAFEKAAARLREIGHEVRSPAEHDIEQGFDPSLGTLDSLDLAASFAWDFQSVCWCDVVVVLPGWEKSVGFSLERKLADTIGTPVYEYLDRGPSTLFWRGPNPLPRSSAETTIVSQGEVRVIDPTTGGAKGQKMARFDLIPANPLWDVAEAYGRGAEKYEERNWERGYKYSLSFAALQRHAWMFWNGQDNDEETGLFHMAQVIFHAMALLEFLHTHPELDDRPNAVS